MRWDIIGIVLEMLCFTHTHAHTIIYFFKKIHFIKNNTQFRFNLKCGGEGGRQLHQGNQSAKNECFQNQNCINVCAHFSPQENI